jgi:sec-independent protein translocase protein TatB
MFDIGWTELALVALIAVLVIGPKDLPRAMKTVAAMVARVRGLAREFQSGIDEMVREAELDEVRSEMNKLATTDVNAAIEHTIDPDASLQNELDLGDGFVPPDDVPPAETPQIEAPQADVTPAIEGKPESSGEKKPAAKPKTAAKSSAAKSKPASTAKAAAKPKTSAAKGKTSGSGGGKRRPGAGSSKSKAEA